MSALARNERLRLLGYLLEAGETTAGLVDDLRQAVVEFEQAPLSMSSVTRLVDRVKAHNGQLAGTAFELARRGTQHPDGHGHSVRVELVGEAGPTLRVVS